MENNGQNGSQGNGGQNERTFTQAELDAIVQRRVGEVTARYSDYDTLKDKAQKYDDAENANKSELQKANEKAAALQAEVDSYKKAESVRGIRESVAKELKVPVELLHGDTKEDCEAQAKTILNYIKPGSYPDVRDGGEPSNTGGKKATRDQFADIFNEL